jgi:hypothetical protein
LLLLIGLNLLAVGWIVGVETEDGAPQVAPIQWTPESHASLMQLPAPKARAAYPQTLARPVFFRDRRPFVPPPSPPPPPAPPPKPVAVVAPPPPVTNPGLSLGGIAITDRDRLAFVRPSSSNDGSWVKEGEEIMGWRVTRITGNSITIQKAQSSIELPLYNDPTKE